MKIVIDFRTAYNNDAALRKFTNEFWKDTALLQPAHDFIFLAGKKATSDQPPKNAVTESLKRTGIKWIDNRRLKNALAKWQANRLVTIQPNGFSIGKRPENKNIAGHILSPFSQVLFAGGRIPEPASALPALTILQPALPEVITSLSWAEAESIKTQYTGGRSFFLFTGNINGDHQLIELLKAFSFFKKWQQSNMQLVIAGNTTGWTAELEEKLSTYKYRADVQLLKNKTVAETAKLVAASYALVYPAGENIFPLSLLWAIQAHKAVIATDSLLNRGLMSAAEWVAPGNTAEGFARAMILLYKDENLLQLLVQQTKEQAKQFNRQQMLETAWHCIEQ